MDPNDVCAIDSSVILRYLLDDVPNQSERARRLIESDVVLAVTAVALAEVAWTLAGPRYRLNRRDVASQLALLLARENIVNLGLDKVEVEVALVRCGHDVGAANFGDALIAATSRSFGVDEIYSFDRQFSRSGMVILDPPES